VTTSLTTCPKCRYVRTTADTAPSWQCPGCGVAYNKVMNETYVPPSPASASRAESGGGWIKWATMVLVIIGLYVAFAQPWQRHHTSNRTVMAQAGGAQPEVLLYGTAWCQYCARTREYFRMHGIQFTDYDVEHNAAAAQGYRRLRGNGVPVVVIGDEVVHGYNPERVGELLRPWLK
jgi:glutaredoxin